jgi:hypothetical protein
MNIRTRDGEYTGIPVPNTNGTLDLIFVKESVTETELIPMDDEDGDFSIHVLWDNYNYALAIVDDGDFCKIAFVRFRNLIVSRSTRLLKFQRTDSTGLFVDMSSFWYPMITSAAVPDPELEVVIEFDV